MSPLSLGCFDIGRVYPNELMIENASHVDGHCPNSFDVVRQLPNRVLDKAAAFTGWFSRRPGDGRFD